ncbi:MAG: 30S ribosomal protein S6 [Deltaproteobacteria bacterium]|nr:MAG: 30S ribosomal protein S6 [Deltaproteobacteria bacterium]
MRKYETVLIVNPEISEEERQPLFDKLKGLVSADGGMLVKFDEWGHKRLAYEIKKHIRGYYLLMVFCGDGALVKEVERNLRLDDRVLKYMTVLVDEAVDPEAIKAEIEAAKEQESKRETAEQATSEGEEKGDAEPVETSEATVSETEQIENTAETSEQEGPK